MALLVLVSVFWAFSFGLIKQLSGCDGAFIAAARLALALLVFLPFLRLRGLAARTGWALAGIGAVQFGLMYLCYNESFRFLKSHEVALFTLTTPVLVTLLADALEKKWRVRSLGAALLAVAGGACVVVKTAPSAATLTGVALVQLSNLAFAAGQVLYRRLRAGQATGPDRAVFGLLYAGALAVALPVSLLRTNFAALPLTATNLGVLCYLGVVASGAGFFLWNRGATTVAAGTLAAMNNLKIPLGVACSVLVFRESTDWRRVLAAGALMAAAVGLAEWRAGEKTP